MLELAGSDRPAFLLEVAEPCKSDEDPDWKEMWHVCPAMGLPKQHHLQQVLPGRCYSFAAAGALASSAQETLGFRCYDNLIQVTTSSASADEKSLKQSLLNTLGLPWVLPEASEAFLRGPGGQLEWPRGPS